MDISVILMLLDACHPDPNPPKHAEMMVWVRAFPEHREAIVDHCVGRLLAKYGLKPVRRGKVSGAALRGPARKRPMPS